MSLRAKPSSFGRRPSLANLKSKHKPHSVCRLFDTGNPQHQYLGRYSIEKLHLFATYTRTASRLRVAVVIMLTPLPTLLAVLAMDLVPLNDPRKGASANTVAFVRSAVSHAVMTFFTLLPLKQALSLSNRDYSFRTIAKIACCTSLAIEALCFPLAFAWRFPVPFRVMVGLPVYVSSVCLFNVVFAPATMRRLWRSRKLHAYLPIVSVQLILFYLCLALSVGFAYLPLLPQALLVATFPFLKVVLKGLVWKAARQLDDVSTDVTICLLEVAGSLYQTVCIESIAAPWMSAVILVTDVVQACHEVRAYVNVDYLGDGRHTLVTALKIIENPIFTDSDETMITTSASTGVVSLADALESARGDSQKTLPAPLGRHLTKHSPTGSMSAVTREGMAATGTGQGEARGRIRPQLQGQSVVVQTKHMRERTTLGGKRRRRLLDLDRFQDEATASNGRVASLEQVESQGRLGSREHVEGFRGVRHNGAKDVMTHVKSAVKHSPTFLARLFSPLRATRRSAVVGAASGPYTDLSGMHTSPPEYTHAGRGNAYEVPSQAVNSGDRALSSPVTRNPPSSLVVEPQPLIRRCSKRRAQCIVIDGITIQRREQARILEQTLQLLFSSEVLLFAEYMEVVIPLMYTVTIGSEWVLPNGQYNLIARSMTASVVTTQVWTALLYALLEAASLLGMYWILRVKYGVSAFYQLAFVLEKYWMTLQGKLVGAFIVVLNAVTVHQGTDFTFQFLTS